MEFLRSLIDIVLHVDRYLVELIQQFGFLTYLILFLIIFCETGLVVTPFLPGDSLLFAAGAIAAFDPSGTLNVYLLWVLLMVAAVLGDTVNYWIGAWVGPRAFSGKVRFLKQEHLEKTQRFYEKYGGKTIILARFVPIVRTFAPFVAGVGTMHYGKFLSYNIIGGVVWVTIFVWAGYLFGNIPLIKNNFEIVAVVIVALSVVPIIVEWLRSRRGAPAAPVAQEGADGPA
jgi:membrane-associated protein